MKFGRVSRAFVSSGYSNDLVMTDFKAYGFKGIIPKPYGGEDFEKVLCEILSP